jgi:hypothetical protein
VNVLALRASRNSRSWAAASRARVMEGDTFSGS